MDKAFRPYRSQLQVRMELPSIGMIKSFVVVPGWASRLISVRALPGIRCSQNELS